LNYRTPGQRFGDYGGEPTTLVCPRGHGVLAAKEVAPELTLAYCTECGGVFATRGAFFRLRNVVEPQVAIFTEWLSALSPHPEPTTRARCPVCAEPMDRMSTLETQEGLSLDICFQHGIWFDGAELEAARAHDTKIPDVRTKEEDARLMQLLRPKGATLPHLRVAGAPKPKDEHGLLWWLQDVFEKPV